LFDGFRIMSGSAALLHVSAPFVTSHADLIFDATGAHCRAFRQWLATKAPAL
jgi:hypothetical protein